MGEVVELDSVERMLEKACSEETDRQIWQCNCGSTEFHIYSDRAVSCAECGGLSEWLVFDPLGD